MYNTAKDVDIWVILSWMLFCRGDCFIVNGQSPARGQTLDFHGLIEVDSRNDVPFAVKIETFQKLGAPKPGIFCKFLVLAKFRSKTGHSAESERGSKI